MKLLPVDYYGSSLCFIDGLTVIPNIHKLYVPCEDGHIDSEEISEDSTVLVLDVMSNGYKRFKISGVSGTMKGCGFVYTSDSRFSRKYGNYPIALHDRKE